jgi:hypothetical protein
MSLQKLFLMGLLSSFALAPTGCAQAPAAPGAAPPNLWSFLLPTAEQTAACKTCFCNSPIGQLTSGAAGPMSTFSGGLIQNRCAQNAIDNVLNDPTKSSTSSEGAAARIKKDEADAKARREAVRFLGTVDCHYWPEATAALILSLRKDPNECVRFEAALALRNGCCCNEKTIKALEMCVTMSDKDGAPPERSDRVRAAAADALAACPLIEKEIETDGKNGDIKKTQAVQTKADYYSRVTPAQGEQIVASARGILVSLQQANKGPTSTPAPAVPPIHHRAGSLSEIVANALNPVSTAPPPLTEKVQAKPASLYELVAARNAKQEHIVPARVSADPSVIPAKPPIALPNAKRERGDSMLGDGDRGDAVARPIVPTGQIGNLPPQLGVSTATPHATNAGQPTNVPPNAKPEDRDTPVQRELRRPMPVVAPTPNGPRETTGYVTEETVPTPPIYFRPARP